MRITELQCISQSCSEHFSNDFAMNCCISSFCCAHFSLSLFFLPNQKRPAAALNSIVSFSAEKLITFLCSNGFLSVGYFLLFTTPLLEICCSSSLSIIHCLVFKMFENSKWIALHANSCPMIYGYLLQSHG